MPADTLKPLILAVDTTGEHGGLALARGDCLLEEAPLHAPGGFAHVLFACAEELLKRHGCEVEDVECFAAASGPGSFTGLRVGLSFVKGLAEATGKPAVAVSNLRALACFGSAPLRAVMIDARRGEVYGAVYSADGDEVAPEQVAGCQAWLRSLPEGALGFVTASPSLLEGARSGSVWSSAPFTLAPASLAAAVASLAAGVLERGEAQDPAALDANYVRRSDAELFWKE
jgi:tRNA threonylcarbamoyladenosine biosynthesis protein TsaB